METEGIIYILLAFGALYTIANAFIFFGKCNQKKDEIMREAQRRKIQELSVQSWKKAAENHRLKKSNV
jgi:hypothetical protein